MLLQVSECPCEKSIFSSAGRHRVRQNWKPARIRQLGFGFPFSPIQVPPPAAGCAELLCQSFRFGLSQILLDPSCLRRQAAINRNEPDQTNFSAIPSPMRGHAAVCHDKAA